MAGGQRHPGLSPFSDIVQRLLAEVVQLRFELLVPFKDVRLCTISGNCALRLYWRPATPAPSTGFTIRLGDLNSAAIDCSRSYM